MRNLTAFLLQPIVFVPLTLTIAALGILSNGTNEALARCENRGGSVAECRLVVLGR